MEIAGPDPTAGTYSQGYQSAVNTRGLVFIESEDPAIGWVCVIPIGITEISSITITAKIGDGVHKGDELGYFSYGGSTLALVFQPAPSTITPCRTGPRTPTPTTARRSAYAPRSRSHADPPPTVHRRTA